MSSHPSAIEIQDNAPSHFKKLLHSNMVESSIQQFWLEASLVGQNLMTL
jgi:hypothetical protein